LGGSLGAVAINDALVKVLTDWPGEPKPEVWHQTGARNLDTAESRYRQAGLDIGGFVRVTGFIDNMAEAFDWADLVVCRSGASTVAELAVAGLPAILIPYPHHKDRQQLLNARWLTETGAAVVIEQSELTTEALLGALLTLNRDRQELAAMSAAALNRGIVDASERIAAQCLGVAHV
jgi:UDP-N-acetylglucosamine--N-acetylmuramyl-(pentapeptide) pyrophosphoryl-undecaprenol N-acetylglucosamine transferase